MLGQRTRHSSDPRGHQLPIIIMMIARLHVSWIMGFITEEHKSQLQDINLRRELAEMCDAPIGSKDDVKVRIDHDKKKVKSAGRALLNSGITIPENRLKELQKVLCDYYEVEEVTHEIMEKAANLESG